LGSAKSLDEELPPGIGLLHEVHVAADISEVSRCFGEEDANDPELRRALAKVVPALHGRLGLAALLGELLLELVETAGSLADVALLPAFRGQQLPVPGLVTPMLFVETRDLFVCCRKRLLARIRNTEPVESLHRLRVRVLRGKPLPVGVLERSEGGIEARLRGLRFALDRSSVQLRLVKLLLDGRDESLLAGQPCVCIPPGQGHNVRLNVLERVDALLQSFAPIRELLQSLA
jgi:hypothetical protein